MKKKCGNYYQQVDSAEEEDVKMVVQNLHEDHDCEEILDATAAPLLEKYHLENGTIPVFKPYATSSEARFSFLVTEIVFITIIIAGNLMIVLTIWMKSSLRTSGFMYIVSVAISHFLVGGVVIPMYIIGHIPHQHLTTVQCKVVEYISCVASAASPYSAVALATHRFREKMFLTTTDTTYKQFIFDSCIVWGFSLLYAGKAIVLYEMVVEVVLEEDTIHCVSMCEVPHSLQDLSNWFLLFDFVLLYIVPCILMLILYFIVGIKVWTSTVDEDLSAIKHRDNLTLTIILLLIVFFFCFFGIYFWDMYVYWGPGHFENSLLWREILKLISFITGWSNVVLILCFNGAFRKTLLKKRRQSRHIGPTSSSKSHQLNDQIQQSGVLTSFKEISKHSPYGNNVLIIRPDERLPNITSNAVTEKEPQSDQAPMDDNVSEYDNVSYQGNKY